MTLLTSSLANRCTCARPKAVTRLFEKSTSINWHLNLSFRERKQVLVLGDEGIRTGVILESGCDGIYKGITGGVRGTTGFSGVYCEVELSPCNGITCQYGGTCKEYFDINGIKNISVYM